MNIVDKVQIINKDKYGFCDIIIDVTKEIKNMFGDVLVKAQMFVSTVDIDHAFSKAESILRNCSETHTDISGDSIILTFINGNTVEFSVSEWGWLNPYISGEDEKYF